MPGEVTFINSVCSLFNNIFRHTRGKLLRKRRKFRISLARLSALGDIKPYECAAHPLAVFQKRLIVIIVVAVRIRELKSRAVCDLSAVNREIMTAGDTGIARNFCGLRLTEHLDTPSGIGTLFIQPRLKLMGIGGITRALVACKINRLMNIAADRRRMHIHNDKELFLLIEIDYRFNLGIKRLFAEPVIAVMIVRSAILTLIARLNTVKINERNYIESIFIAKLLAGGRFA